MTHNVPAYKSNKQFTVKEEARACSTLNKTVGCATAILICYEVLKASIFQITSAMTKYEYHLQINGQFK